MEKYGLDKQHKSYKLNKSNQKPLYKVQLIIIPQTPYFVKNLIIELTMVKLRCQLLKYFWTATRQLPTHSIYLYFFDSKMSSIINKMDKFCTNIISLHKLVMICTAVNKCNTVIRLILYSVGYLTTCPSESTVFCLKSTNNKKYPTI